MTEADLIFQSVLIQTLYKKKIPHTNIFTFYRDQALLGGPKCSSQPLAHLFYLQPKYEHKEFQVSCYLLAVKGLKKN